MRKFHHHLVSFGSLLLALHSGAQTVPTTLNYQGRLTDNGTPPAPLTATVAMQFALYDASSGGAALWQEPAGAGTVPVSVTGGIFSIQLGSNGVPLPASLFAPGNDRWLEIRVGGEALAPRQKLGASGWAQQAQGSFDSAALGGVAASGWQARVSDNCAPGKAISAIDAAGLVTCQATGETYLAGNGLDLTASTFSVNFAGTGAALTAARSDHTHLADTVLLISKDGTGRGTVTTSAAELPSCAADQTACAAAFRPSTASVTLTATPDANSTFAGWGGDCSGMAGCSVTLAANRRATAKFNPLLRTVTVSNTFNATAWVEGVVFSGAGGFSGAPGIYCGALCAADFPAALSVVLRAVPTADGNYAFHGWTGVCSGTSGFCTVPPATTNQSVTASFDYAFFLRPGINFPNGIGSAGSISAAALGIDCNTQSGPTCNTFQPPNVTVSLLATPGAGAKFLHWQSSPRRPTLSGGPCNNVTATTCSVTPRDPLNINALFGYTLTLTNLNGNGGTAYMPDWFQGSYSTLACGACSGSTLTNDSVTLRVTPYAGHTFLGWGGACSGTSTTCVLLMNGDKAVTANFS